MTRTLIVSRIATTHLATVATLVAFLSNDAFACQMCAHATTDCCHVPVWVEVEQECVVKVPYTEEIERTFMVTVPHAEQVERTCTVMVPHTEIRQGTKTVTKCVPETKTCTVSKDFGCWATELVEVPCEGCDSACGACDLCCGGHACGGADQPCQPATRTVCRRVWVPDVRTKEIPVTTYRMLTEEVPCEYTVTEYHPEQRTRTLNVVRYTVEPRTETLTVTRYRDETRTRKVRVCKMVCQSCAAECNVCD